jgi:folate-dependent phosphoribosylglycinamide formyltransferase PurN
LSNLLENTQSISGIVILKNNSIDLIKKGLYLRMVGAKNIGANLINNSLKMRIGDPVREKLAKKYSIPIHYFQSSNDPQFEELVKNQKIDLLINARTRDIYKKKILQAPKIACINVHHGVLPKYRGTMCDLYAIFENRTPGFSVHYMDRKIDNGKIIEVVSSKNKFNYKINDYEDYIFKSSIYEGKVISFIVNNWDQVTMPDKLIPNNSEAAIYTKNPDIKLIRQMLKAGIIL